MSAADLVVRPARREDAKSICEIYNAGLASRMATFETEPRTEKDVLEWLKGTGPVLVVEAASGIVAFSRASTYRPRACYDGVREYSVYVAPGEQRKGYGEAALKGLITACRTTGTWKLVSRIFPENMASIALAEKLGFRNVGTYRRHGQLEGVWKDCVIVELLL